MLSLIKKIKTLFSLLNYIEVKNNRINIQTMNCKVVIGEKGIKIETEENIVINGKLVLINCEPEFNPIEEKREELESCLIKRV